LYASVDRGDPSHSACALVFRRRDYHFVFPSLVIAETAYLVGARFGASAEAGFIRRIGALAIETPNADEWRRIADLIEQYRDFPLGATDASVVVLAERFQTSLILTLDRRHFGVIRPDHVPAFRLLPD
jgi:predicted nucleic acid-binding protein